MASRYRNIRVDGLDKWIDGLDKFADPDAEDVAMWRAATDVFFAKTQDLVHIDSGDLKKSGRTDTREQGNRIVGEVEYGGTPEVNYAVYEFRRGGAHDALLRGYLASQRHFQATLAEMLVKKVDRWK
jgi:hypothetical protein